MKIKNISSYRRFWTEDTTKAYKITIRYYCTKKEHDALITLLTEDTKKLVGAN